MTDLASMTGFARSEGVAGTWRYVWEIKSVNGRGLDIRMRVPPGYDQVGERARRLAGQKLVRGNLQIGLALTGDGSAGSLHINMDALRAVLDAVAAVALPAGVAPARLDGLLALRGIVENGESGSGIVPDEITEAAITDGFATALDGLVAMRRAEGRALREVLASQLDRIEALAAAADANPARKVERVRERLAEQVALLLDAAPALDPARLHQEAVLLASRSDIREELDRLAAHVSAARELLAQGGAVGRRLDFLAQEFSREANTLCSKSNDVSLTAIGLDLKAVIEQFREQVQNVE